MSKIIRAGACCFSLFLFQFLNAQDIVETQWYFGNSSAAFEIDKSTRAANLRTNQTTPLGTGGSAVISEQFTGDLLFYSDGQLVYDATHTLLPTIAGGTQLSGDPSLNQPVVACPFPDNSNRYYLFTNNGAAIEYSVIDASIAGNSSLPQFPLGNLTTVNQPTGLTDPAQGMKIMESNDGQSFWLLTQNTTTFEFMVTPITGAGPGTPVAYDIIPSTLPNFEAVQYALLEDTISTIAVAPREANRNVVLLEFNHQTGVLTYSDNVPNTGFADAGNTVIFDVEWSGDGTKLYISRTGDDTNAGNLCQVDYADTVNTDPRLVTQVLPYTFYRSYGLKRGIDGRIYHLYQLNDAGSPFTLGRINRPDSVAASVFYDSLLFEEDFNGRQFPEFAPPYLSTNFFNMSFTYFDSCETNATKFVALVDPLPQNYFWSFGDGGGSTGPAPIHTYDAAGGYLVSLGVELNGIFQVTTLPIDIFPGDTVDLGNDTTICVDEILELDAGEGSSYLWSTGEMTQTIEVDTAGTYWVEVVGLSGCTDFDDIVVTEYGVNTQVSNQWYFGEMAGLDFTFGAPVAITDANQMFSPDGCASISDINGDLLFYTNGSTVWNKDHFVMVNGDSIGGDSTAAQSAMILPLSDDYTMYYVFTTEEVYGDFTFNMKLTIVDMKADSARGKVLIKNVPLIENSTEKLTASGFTGTPWLLAREYGNTSFRAYPVSANGIIGALYSAAGEPLSFQEEPGAGGYLKFAPGGNYVAAVIPGDTNYINLLNFDVATGALSNSRLIDIEEYGTERIYGLEFSGDLLKLYVTTANKLIQYDLDSINAQDAAADIQATKHEYASTLTGYGALQTGPNGVIYVAIDGAGAVGSISNPGGNDDAAGFQEDAVDLGGRISRRGLPNFTQQAGAGPPQPQITTEVACAGQETVFSGVGRDTSIETYEWDFGDGTIIGGLTNPDTTHTYLVDSTYIVRLTLSNRCDTDTTLIDTVQVFNIPELPMVPADTSLCGGPITLSAWDVDRPDLNYYWSTGDSTRSVVFNSPAIVDVAIYNDDGCSSDTLRVFIAQDETFIDLGADRIFCQGDSTALLDANDPGPIYSWTRDGVVVGDQRTQAINTAAAGEFVYAVAVENTFSGCIYRDSVLVTVQPEPQVEQANQVSPECGMANGSFELLATTAGGYSYNLSGPVTANGSFDNNSPALITGLPSGSYTTIITNTVSGCTNTEVFQLEDNAPFDIEAVPMNDCALTGDISIRFIDDLPASVELNVLDQFGASVFNSVNSLSTREITVNDLDSGTYYVEVRDVDPPNCVQIDTVRLSVAEECFRSIFIPNAFSPGAGTNLNEEYFAFPNEYVDRFQIFIYNRWGDLVYYSTNKDFRWDGKYEGQIVSPGTYAVKILFTSTLEPELGTIEQFGTVTVVR